MSRLSTTVFSSTWILGAALSIASPASAEECRKDLDCPGDTVCDAGRCVGADGPSPVSAPVAPAAQTTTQQPAAPAAAAPVAAAPVAAAPAQAPIAGAVPVRFTLRSPGVPLLVRDMATNASCTAPCTLSLPSGPRTMRIGSARAEDFDVPPGGGTFSVAEPTRGRRNGGTVLLSVGGGVALISGLIVLAASSAASEDTSSWDTTTTPTDDGTGTAKTVGTVGLVMGIGSMVAGVAMLLSSDMAPIRPSQDAGLEKQASKIKVRPTAGFDSKSGFLGLAGAF